MHATILIQPTYFPSISTMVGISQAEIIFLEQEDNFQKQTNRNRMYIYSPNGLQLLNIPVKHAKNNKQQSKDIRVENDFGWQKQHLKSLEAAYRSSPFFEYFEDYLQPIFEKRYLFLKDIQQDSFEFLNKCIGMNPVVFDTTKYFANVTDALDLRNLANGKKDVSVFEPYTQVFNKKFGYLNNLSSLDLLFNEGRYALDYLKKQRLFF